MKERNKLNLALVGCGDIAGAYLDATRKTKRCRLAQVMDVNLALAEQRGKENGVPATARYEDVLANTDVDAVILSVPHFLHAPMTLQAFDVGKYRAVVASSHFTNGFSAQGIGTQNGDDIIHTDYPTGQNYGDGTGKPAGNT